VALPGADPPHTGGNVYAIVMERLYPLDDSEKAELLIDATSFHRGWLTTPMEVASELRTTRKGSVSEAWLRAVLFLWRHGFHPSDLHSGNMMKRADGTYVVSDFGLSFPVKGERTASRDIPRPPINRSRAKAERAAKKAIAKMSPDELFAALQADGFQANPRRTRRVRTAPTVLDPRHAALVATPAFKRWFRDSKVVSESGEPLVVYHGSPDIRHVFGGMTTFRSPPAFFATDVYGVANTYTPKGVLDYQNSEPGVIPLFVSMQNPMVIDARGARFRKTEHYVHQAYRDGHDGIIILNSVDDYLGSGGMGLATVYAWFDPRQAKSAVLDEMRSRIDGKALSFATPNSGNFDPTNPDIRMNPRRRNPRHRKLPSMTWLRANAVDDIEEGHAFFDAKERVQEIAEENGEEPPEDEQLREAVWDYLGDVTYADFALEVRKFTNPIRIFRAVALAAVGGVDTLRTHELGVYWTWDEYAAEPYWGGVEHPARETTTFVIEALVAPADVNWESTLIANMTRPEEKEVTLREGAPVRVVAVYDLSAKERVRGEFDARANPHRKRRR
jgi:hypothetical protein